MNKIYDCIVLGVGGVGSAALYYAAAKGWNVLGIEQFSVVHALGSSHGQTRIIRQAYFEHPDYVPLLKSAYGLWEQFEKTVGRSLFQRTGLLEVGHPDGPIIGGIRRSANEHGLAIRELNARELKAAYPFFSARQDDVAIVEENAGFLRVEPCLESFVEAAQELGATVLENVVVDGWDDSDGVVTVSTSDGVFHAKRIILTAGPWANACLPSLQIELKVIAKHQHWFRFTDDRINLKNGCPTFFFETDEGYFYGFPDLDGRGAKICEHSGGVNVDDPLNIRREIDLQDLERVQNFCNQYLDFPRGIHQDHRVCMYTMSPDEHFIVDRVAENCVFACGLSGHGFKFIPVLGQALVEMLEGRSRADMDFLRVSRFNTDAAKA